jgi:hypothetical protein
VGGLDLLIRAHLHDVVIGSGRRAWPERWWEVEVEAAVPSARSSVKRRAERTALSSTADRSACNTVTAAVPGSELITYGGLDMKRVLAVGATRAGTQVLRGRRSAREGIEHPFVEGHAAQLVSSGVDAAVHGEVAALAGARLNVVAVDTHRRGAEEALAPGGVVVGDAAKPNSIERAGVAQEFAQV